MKICFIDKTDFKYSFRDKFSPNLRGAETTLINLSYNLMLLGCKIFVFNNCSDDYTEKNYYWNDIRKLQNENNKFDIAIANGDINLLNNVNANKKFVISYSHQNIEKFIRKRQTLSYLINKPKIIFIGNYHESKRSYLLKFFGYKFLQLCVDDIFLESQIDNDINNKNAIFTSRPDRNLLMLLNIWINRIYPHNRSLNLFVTPNNFIKNKNEYNIHNREMRDQNHLVKQIKNSRLMLIPGHKSELFCLAAEEAKELCVPIVTLGIGSLRERVEHNITGFIANDEKEFANYTIKLFENNTLWNKIRYNLLKIRGKNSWKISAAIFLKELMQ